MYLLYSLLLTIGLIAASPLFVIEALRNGKYIVGLTQRLGRIPRINSNNLPIIWLHCVSVGELAAARTLVDAIIDRFPSHRLVVSTTTITGQNVARQMFSKQAAAIFYFPIDWACFANRSAGDGLNHGNRVVAATFSRMSSSGNSRFTH